MHKKYIDKEIEKAIPTTDETGKPLNAIKYYYCLIK
jgi:hypothetical protein